jgi:Icc-related predicted phosphoesterase
MKIRLLSDIHNEFGTFQAQKVEADVIVLAGDIDVKGKAIAWIESSFPECPVLYVLGNHEFYGQALPRQIDKIKAQTAGKNIQVLENNTFRLCEVEFFGCTFWTDLRLLGNQKLAVFEAEQRMTDYRVIRLSPQYRKLRAQDTIFCHARSREWLRQAVRESEAPKKVIITHHAPSPLSLPGDPASDMINSAYASDEIALIEELGADLWVHGHIHTSCDYMAWRTRVLCNPRGYLKKRIQASGRIWLSKFEPVDNDRFTQNYCRRTK